MGHVDYLHRISNAIFVLTGSRKSLWSPASSSKQVRQKPVVGVSLGKCEAPDVSANSLVLRRELGAGAFYLLTCAEPGRGAVLTARTNTVSFLLSLDQLHPARFSRRP